jgi:hypothetical protein
MEVSGQLHTPAALLTGKNLLVPIGYEARCSCIANTNFLLQMQTHCNEANPITNINCFFPCTQLNIHDIEECFRYNLCIFLSSAVT